MIVRIQATICRFPIVAEQGKKWLTRGVSQVDPEDNVQAIFYELENSHDEVSK